jgi:hypothetical protein
MNYMIELTPEQMSTLRLALRASAVENCKVKAYALMAADQDLFDAIQEQVMEQCHVKV